MNPVVKLLLLVIAVLSTLAAANLYLPATLLPEFAQLLQSNNASLHKLPVLEAQYFHRYVGPPEVMILSIYAGSVAIALVALMHLFIRYRLSKLTYTSESIRIDSINLPNNTNPYVKETVSQTTDLVEYTMINADESTNNDYQGIGKNYVSPTELLPLTSVLCKQSSLNSIVKELQQCDLEVNQIATAHVSSNNKKIRVLTTKVPKMSYFGLLMIFLFPVLPLWLIFKTSVFTEGLENSYSPWILLGCIPFLLLLIAAGMARTLRAVT